MTTEALFRAVCLFLILQSPVSDLRISVHGASSAETSQQPGADHLPPSAGCRTPVALGKQMPLFRHHHASSFNKADPIAGCLSKSLMGSVFLLIRCGQMIRPEHNLTEGKMCSYTHRSPYRASQDTGSQGTVAGHLGMCNVDRASASLVAREGEKAGIGWLCGLYYPVCLVFWS